MSVVILEPWISEACGRDRNLARRRCLQARTSTEYVVQNDDCVEMTLGLIAWPTTNNPRPPVSLFWLDCPRVSLLGLGEVREGQVRVKNKRSYGKFSICWLERAVVSAALEPSGSECSPSCSTSCLNRVGYASRWGGQ